MALERPAQPRFPSRLSQPEQHRSSRAVGLGEVAVAVELAGDPGERLAPGVVLHEELDAAAVLLPDAVGVGSDQLAPLGGAPPLGPPGDDGRIGPLRVPRLCRAQKKPFTPSVWAVRWPAASATTRSRSTEVRGGIDAALGATTAAPSGPSV